MRVSYLVFHYDLEKLAAIRGNQVYATEYVNTEFIFQYSAASVASFLHFNRGTPLNIYTDDIELFTKCLDKYDVEKNVKMIDWREQIGEYKQNPYAFYILLMFVKENCSHNEDSIKLDNDLICKRSIADIQLGDRILMWRDNGLRVCQGSPDWGEIMACEKAIGTSDFNKSNPGVLGIPCKYSHLIDEVAEVSNKLASVDISPIASLMMPNGRPTKMWHCCEETAWNYIVHKHGIPITYSTEYFDHPYHRKSEVLERTKHLLKQS